MTMQGAVLRSDALRASPVGCEVDIRLAWYRSLPLSCVTGLGLRIDGTEVPAADIRLDLNGQAFGLDDLAARSDEWWFIQDAGTLRAALRPAIRPGQRVEVSVRLQQRIPYIIIGPGQALATSATATRLLTAGEARGGTA